MSINDLIRQQLARREHLRALEEFILTDQWQGGDGWTGPHPVDLPSGTKRDITTLIERQFVSRNILAEVVTRHRDGVVGLEPRWEFAQRTGRKKLTDEAEAALTSWWDDTGIPAVLQAAVRTLLFSGEKDGKRHIVGPGRSPLRMHIRSRSVDDSGRVPRRASLEEALADISVHAAAPYAAGIVRNEDGDAIATHYAYGAGDDARVEVTGVAWVLRSNGFTVPSEYPPDATVVLVLKKNGDVVDDAGYALGGRLLMHEMEREPLVTPAAISQQKLINKAYTMMSHNLDIAGFTERTLLNAQMPGHYVDEAGQRVSSDDGGTFVPDPLHVGAGATNFFAGIASVDDNGVTRYANPSVVYRDPVNPEAFTRTIDAAEIAVLKEAKQLHVALAGDGVASGASRIQAANDFVGSLETTAVEVQKAVRWALDTALSLASVLMGAPSRYEELRPVVTARLSAVQPTPEDVKATIDKKIAGLVSRQTAMSEVGVEDVDAEIKKIASETDTVTGEGMPVAGDEISLRDRAEAFAVLFRAGIGPESALRTAGLTEAEHTGAAPITLRQPEDAA
ncbi:MAG: hypothetical protein H0X64_09610 [Gemmatimonadaceae bacterium]|nr:hypothetical protein [Gemmatimonadaceae bacterium]